MQRRASLRAWERRSRKGDQPRLQQAKLPGQRLAAPVQNHGEAFRAIAAFEPPLEDDRGWPLDACGSARIPRSEERRVGKECRSRWWPYHARNTERSSEGATD